MRLGVALLLLGMRATAGFVTGGAIMPSGRWVITETNDPWIARMGPQVTVCVQGNEFRVNQHVYGTFQLLNTSAPPEAVSDPKSVDMAMRLWNVPLFARRFTLYPTHIHKILLTTADRRKFYQLKRVSFS
jgi:hypothetical protein